MNIGLLTWCLSGGLILYFINSNFLTLLVKPTFNKPINYISEFLERDMGLIMWVGMDYYIDVMNESTVEKYQKESFLIINDFNPILINYSFPISHVIYYINLNTENM